MAASSAAIPASVRPSRASAPTFARRRLRLGITGVGGTVVLAALWLGALLLDVVPLSASWRVVEGPLGVPVTAGVVACAAFLAHAVVMLPIEHAGGRIAVRRVPRLGTWLTT